MKYEKKREPTQAASAARTGLTFNLVMIGAVIEAAVIIATVPLPWIKRIKVAIIKGNKIGGNAVSINDLAITSPTPLSLINIPKAPPAPVIKIIVPADFIPISTSSKTLCLSKFLVKP